MRRPRPIPLPSVGNDAVARALTAAAEASITASPLEPAVAAEVLKAAGAFSISAALDRILQLIILEFEKDREAEAARERQKGGRP
jgi:hypothetical protein